MKSRCAITLVSLCLTAAAGCIRWEQADQGWCNDAALEQRHAVCGLPDTSVAGAVPAIESGHRLGGGGDESLVAMTRVGADIFIAGDFSSPVTLGDTLVSRGGKDGYIARLGSDGQPQEAISFGSFGEDAVVDLEAGPPGTFFVAARYVSNTSAPGGLTFSSSGAEDSFVMRLNGAMQPVALTDFTATSGSRVKVLDVNFSNGQVAVAGRLEGSMVLGGALVGSTGPAAFFVVYDENLVYQWHAITELCTDAIGDSAAIGPSGEAYFTFRVLAGDNCMLATTQIPRALNLNPPQQAVEPWQDVRVRVDFNGAGASVPPGWLELFPFSLRTPFLQPGKVNPGYDAPNRVAVVENEVVYLHHRPDFTPFRRPAADIGFFNTSDALPSRSGYEVGRSIAFNGSGQEMLAKLHVEGHRLWLLGEFQDDNMLLDDLENGPFVQAKQGFVRLWDLDDSTKDWARVIVGRTPSHGGSVHGVVQDDSGRTWIGGTFDGNVVATDVFLDAEGFDAFVYITEP